MTVEVSNDRVYIFFGKKKNIYGGIVIFTILFLKQLATISVLNKILIA